MGTNMYKVEFTRVSGNLSKKQVEFIERSANATEDVAQEYYLDEDYLEQMEEFATTKELKDILAFLKKKVKENEGSLCFVILD